ncbi:MAG TPA: glycoside hydrolase family 15 protein [Candidatus Polarisedimenticolia bacterium]|nr:glycoside hydrolase family 15 protein [Candidatus Polarisedimenticolia bacterium]
MITRIEDYALIGNTCTAALVAKDGSLDWLCVPRFDSAACFAALLGDENNGRWQIAPAGGVKRVRRKYRENTLVLETEFDTADGTVALIDFMPIRERPRQVDVVRIVEGRKGRVPMRMQVKFRFDYGSLVPWVTADRGGLRAVAGPDALKLRTPVRLYSQDFSTLAEFNVGEGQKVPFTLTYYPSHEAEPRNERPERMLSETESGWRAWVGRYDVPVPWHEAVVRSLITLKALTYRYTGGIVAAPTTSLPERLGGNRNWDYRYAWLRDSTFTLWALYITGHKEEAAAWREWLLRAVAGEPHKIRIMYGVAGERWLPELEVPWLSGYEKSAPVKIGNAAHQQFQLDVFGEVMDTLYAAHKQLGGDGETWNLQQVLMDYLEGAWREPDDGIWEVRGPRRHFTHSKTMAWVAADRAVRCIERFGCEGPVERWKALREEIRADVLKNGYNERRKAFVQSYGSDHLDASVLMMPMVGFIDASDPRMESTVAAIERELMHEGLLLRYQTENQVDGLAPGEGAFLACTFWYADNLAMMGRRDEARATFERLLSLRNDVGLLSEEYDPRNKRMLGNFPQAFSHVAVINTAHNLALAKGPAVHRAG